MPTQDDDFLFRLESADAAEFAALLREASPDDLQSYFGAEADELRALAEPHRGVESKKLGNVVVLHGVLGAHLAEGASTIWLNPWSLVQGKMDRLLPGAAHIEPRGLIKRYYGRQLLTLAERWNVRAFAYDWRLTLDESARALATAIDTWFPAGEPVHLVAHSMGGLVARTFLQLRPAHAGRLVMLGTPNRGSYAIPQLLHGMHSLLSPLALLDLQHSRHELLEIIRSWPGVHAMDPANAGLAPLPVDAARMVYIAGAGKTTAVGIRDAARLGEPEGYHWSGAGDGTVAHSLGLLDGVPTYFVNEEHGALPSNPDVLAAVDQILETGSTSLLPSKPAQTRGSATAASTEMAGFLCSPSKAIAPIAIRHGDLQSAADVDAIVVGHYEGVPPLLVESRPALRAMAGHLPTGLGEPFYLPAANGEPALLVIGLGPVGRLREPELRTFVERLCWAAAQFGIAHVATTLIGSGAGNLAVEQAAAVWRETLANHKLRVTFYEHDEDRAAALASHKNASHKKRTNEPKLPANSLSERKIAPERDVVPRLSLAQTRTGYRLALLTRDASIPEREISLDHQLVDEMNAKLLDRRENTAEWAECLRRLLLPAELRQAASLPGPVVVACDRATAQIHWEHLHPEVSRQFRSLKAPFRSGHPSARRVLLVADTCADAPLAGAADEGRALAELLAQRGLDVTALIGPNEATRAAVLRELLLRPYDILHYAGHCFYASDDPAASGWVFTGAATLSARELERLDRVPSMIFSNACESGIIAPGPNDVPGFAEALFGLGVQNLIATARPVGDQAASAFARAFYETAAAPFHQAMRAARSAAGAESTTWQHYGNPSEVLFSERPGR